MSGRDKIIDKIKKCLALSASSNEHEAAAALRQAKILMESHGVTEVDVLAAQADERRAKSGAKSKPANWEAMLVAKIADAFNCRVIYASGFWNRLGEWCFIGCGAAPEVAQYVFSVLRCQAKRAREEHIKANLKRCKTVTKTRRADLFSEGWVWSVTKTIASFAGNEQQTAAIEAFTEKHYPSLGSLKTRDRNDGRKLSEREYDDYSAGHRSGKDAQLNRGVGGVGETIALGVAA